MSRRHGPNAAAAFSVCAASLSDTERQLLLVLNRVTKSNFDALRNELQQVPVTQLMAGGLAEPGGASGGGDAVTEAAWSRRWAAARAAERLLDVLFPKLSSPDDTPYQALYVRLLRDVLMRMQPEPLPGATDGVAASAWWLSAVEEMLVRRAVCMILQHGLPSDATGAPKPRVAPVHVDWSPAAGAPAPVGCTTCACRCGCCADPEEAGGGDAGAGAASRRTGSATRESHAAARVVELCNKPAAHGGAGGVRSVSGSVAAQSVPLGEGLVAEGSLAAEALVRDAQRDLRAKLENEWLLRYHERQRAVMSLLVACCSAQLVRAETLRTRVLRQSLRMPCHRPAAPHPTLGPPQWPSPWSCCRACRAAPQPDDGLTPDNRLDLHIALLRHLLREVVSPAMACTTSAAEATEAEVEKGGRGTLYALLDMLWVSITVLYDVLVDDDADSVADENGVEEDDDDHGEREDDDALAWRRWRRQRSHVSHRTLYVLEHAMREYRVHFPDDVPHVAEMIAAAMAVSHGVAVEPPPSAVADASAVELHTAFSSKSDRAPVPPEVDPPAPVGFRKSR